MNSEFRKKLKDEDKELAAFLDGLEIEPPSSNLAAKISLTAQHMRGAVQEEQSFIDFLSDKVFAVFMMPRSALALACSLAIGYFFGVSDTAVTLDTMQSEFFSTDLIEGDWL